MMTGDLLSIQHLSSNQIRMLKRFARHQANIDLAKGKDTGIKEWMAIDLLTSSSLRISEVAKLKCGDIRVGYGDSRIFVRRNMRDISSFVIISESLKQHLESFLAWKERKSEPIGKDDPLFMGQKGKWTSKTIRRLLENNLKELNINEPDNSFNLDSFPRICG